jgi:hypothetical protein
LYAVRKVLNLSNAFKALGCCEAGSMVYRSMLTTGYFCVISVVSDELMPAVVFM